MPGPEDVGSAAPCLVTASSTHDTVSQPPDPGAQAVPVLCPAPERVEEDAVDGARGRVAPAPPAGRLSPVSLVSLSLEDETGAGDGPPRGPSVADSLEPLRARGLDRLERLEGELEAAQRELKLKDQEVEKLNGIRNQIEAEMEELTASLFQEAHKMVLAANEKQAASEKALLEAKMKIEVLEAEVLALKTLVITSTPSRPNPHLHPQIEKANGIKIFKKGHHRSPSNQELIRPDASPPESPARTPPHRPPTPDLVDEVDPRLLSAISEWREHPSLDLTSGFMAAAYREDIQPCLTFATDELSERVLRAVLQNDICVEDVSTVCRGPNFPSGDDCRRCALLNVPRNCRYRMKLSDTNTWMDISQICRNRIIAVCDFLNYLRYIQQGLVKGSLIDIYREIMRLRKNIALARLGFEV